MIGTHKTAIRISVALAIAALAAACGGSDTTDAPAATTAAAAAETTEAMAEMPSQLDVAFIMLGTKEEGWYATMLDSMARVAEDNEFGLTINVDELEEIALADGERVIRDLADSGEYEIIIAHSSYVDSVQAVHADYPDILFAYSGSGNDDHVGGANAYWIDVFIHEPAYLMGIAAGMMTQTDKISAVAAFPFPNVNAPLNAFIDGAESVNPDVEVAGVAYIEGWFDPATAGEAASAQIAAGSDMIYAERFGPHAPAEDAGNVSTFGHFTDQLDVSPTTLASAVAHWDAAFTDLVKAWYAYTTAGTPYNAPPERIVYQSMTEGGSALGRLSESLPAEVTAAIEAAREAIFAGELEIPLVIDPIE